MNIYISADDNYIVPTKVMLTSLLVNNRKEFHNIYFMYNSIQSNNLKELESLVGQFQARLHPLHIHESLFEGFRSTNQYPLLVYYRLLVPQLLPATEDRALWMDVDLIVNGSLDEFYYQDFDGAYLVACRDCDHPDRLPQLGCPPGAVYVNAGVILFNAVAMRQYQLSDFVEYYSTHEKFIKMQDQDIINGMFSSHTKIMDSNTYNTFAPSICSVHEYRSKAFKQAKIIHFIGKHKPWSNTYANPAGALWDRYYLLTFNKGLVFSFFYRIARYFIRFVQRTFIVPLRILHGKLHEKKLFNM